MPVASVEEPLFGSPPCVRCKRRLTDGNPGVTIVTEIGGREVSGWLICSLCNASLASWLNSYDPKSG